MVKGKKTKKTEFSISMERIEAIGCSGIEGIELKFEIKCTKHDEKYIQDALVGVGKVCRDWDYVSKFSISIEITDYKRYRNS